LPEISDRLNEDLAYVQCVIKMLENLEKQIELSSDYVEIQSLQMHKRVVMRLVDQLTLETMI